MRQPIDDAIVALDLLIQDWSDGTKRSIERHRFGTSDLGRRPNRRDAWSEVRIDGYTNGGELAGFETFLLTERVVEELVAKRLVEGKKDWGRRDMTSLQISDEGVAALYERVEAVADMTSPGSRVGRLRARDWYERVEETPWIQLKEGGMMATLPRTCRTCGGTEFECQAFAAHLEADDLWERGKKDRSTALHAEAVGKPHHVRIPPKPGHDVYLSSSWKNRARVRALAEALRANNISVYDFTDPSCRSTPEIPPENFPETYDPEQTDDTYSDYLRRRPEWAAAVAGNRITIARAEIVLLLLPCGLDAHADWALAVGLGKKTAVVGVPAAGVRVPTHLWSDAMFMTDNEAIRWTRKTMDALSAETKRLAARRELGIR